MYQTYERETGEFAPARLSCMTRGPREVVSVATRSVTCHILSKCYGQIKCSLPGTTPSQSIKYARGSILAHLEASLFCQGPKQKRWGQTECHAVAWSHKSWSRPFHPTKDMPSRFPEPTQQQPLANYEGSNRNARPRSSPGRCQFACRRGRAQGLLGVLNAMTGCQQQKPSKSPVFSGASSMFRGLGSRKNRPEIATACGWSQGSKTALSAASHWCSCCAQQMLCSPTASDGIKVVHARPSTFCRTALPLVGVEPRAKY